MHYFIMYGRNKKQLMDLMDLARNPSQQNSPDLKIGKYNKMRCNLGKNFGK